jgi:hypothetical protein
MRSYSPQELDVMAEAYERALKKAPQGISSIDATLRLVQEIAQGVVNGLRDEEVLAEAALARSRIDATAPAWDVSPSRL